MPHEAYTVLVACVRLSLCTKTKNNNGWPETDATLYEFMSF